MNDIIYIYSVSLCTAVVEEQWIEQRLLQREDW